MAEDPITWTALKTSLETWMIRDDLTDIVPECIAFVEREFQRLVFAPERIETATLSASGASVALPADFWGVRTVYTDTTPKRLLTQVTPSYLKELYPYSTTGILRHFAIEGETMLLGPPPSATTSVELSYWETIPALDADNPTNWLLTDHPDLYLAASRAWLSEYVRDYQAADRWNGKAAAIIESINDSGRRREFSGPLRAIPARSDAIISFIR